MEELNKRVYLLGTDKSLFSVSRYHIGREGIEGVYMRRWIAGGAEFTQQLVSAESAKHNGDAHVRTRSNEQV